MVDADRGREWGCEGVDEIVVFLRRRICERGTIGLRGDPEQIRV